MPHIKIMKKAKKSQPDIHLVKIRQEGCEDCEGILECICTGVSPEISSPSNQ